MNETKFTFRPRSIYLDLTKIEKIDINKIENGVDVDALQEHVTNVTFCAVSTEMVQINSGQFCKAFRLAQLIIEYLMFCQTFNEKRIAELENELENVKKNFFTIASMLCEKEKKFGAEKVELLEKSHSTKLKSAHRTVISRVENFENEIRYLSPAQRENQTSELVARLIEGKCASPFMETFTVPLPEFTGFENPFISLPSSSTEENISKESFSEQDVSLSMTIAKSTEKSMLKNFKFSSMISKDEVSDFPANSPNETREIYSEQLINSNPIDNEKFSALALSETNDEFLKSTKSDSSYSGSFLELQEADVLQCENVVGVVKLTF